MGYFVNPGWESDCQGEIIITVPRKVLQFARNCVPHGPKGYPSDLLLDKLDALLEPTKLEAILNDCQGEKLESEMENVYCTRCDKAMSWKEYHSHYCAISHLWHNMTRQEAIDKLDGIYPSGERISLVNALAALGLLKFEKENPVKGNLVANVIGFSVSQSYATPGHNDMTAIGKAVIEDLAKSGYRIMKMGGC